MIEYVIQAAQASNSIERIICSTDSERIAAFCESKGVEVHHRPDELAGDDVPVLKALQHLLDDIHRKEGRIAGIIPLLQPTSPFLLPEHIDELVSQLEQRPESESAQTIATIPHNFHAFNQRLVNDDQWLQFVFHEERLRYYNKQSKPVYYRFGNLVICKSETLLYSNEIFGKRSVPLVIPEEYALDVDGPADLLFANYQLQTQSVQLPFILK